MISNLIEKLNLLEEIKEDLSEIKNFFQNKEA
ncbi:hypothetical protein [Anaerovirgula multivorans]